MPLAGRQSRQALHPARARFRVVCPRYQVHARAALRVQRVGEALSEVADATADANSAASGASGQPCKETQAISAAISACDSVPELIELTKCQGQVMNAFTAGGLACKLEQLLAASLNNRQRVALLSADERLQPVIAVIDKCLPSMNEVGIIQVLSLCKSAQRSQRLQRLADSAITRISVAALHSGALFLRHFTQLLTVSSAIAASRASSAPTKAFHPEPFRLLADQTMRHIISVAPKSQARDVVTACKLLTAQVPASAVTGSMDNSSQRVLTPVLTALANAVQGRITMYNGSQLAIVAQCFRKCNFHPRGLYSAITALLTTRSLRVDPKEAVRLLWALHCARQTLQQDVQHALVHAALRAVPRMRHSQDVASLAVVARHTADVSALDVIVLADWLLHNSDSCRVADIVIVTHALIAMGCTHDAALLVFRNVAMNHAVELQPTELQRAAACCAHPSLGDLWPIVASAAGLASRSHRACEFLTMARYATELCSHRELHRLPIVLRHLRAPLQAACRQPPSPTSTEAEPAAEDAEDVDRGHDHASLQVHAALQMLEHALEGVKDEVPECGDMLTELRSMHSPASILDGVLGVLGAGLRESGAASAMLQQDAMQDKVGRLARLLRATKLARAAVRLDAWLGGGHCAGQALPPALNAFAVVCEERLSTASPLFCQQVLFGFVCQRWDARKAGPVALKVLECTCARLDAVTGNIAEHSGAEGWTFQSVSKALWCLAKLDIWPAAAARRLMQHMTAQLQSPEVAGGSALEQAHVVSLCMATWALGKRCGRCQTGHASQAGSASPRQQAEATAAPPDPLPAATADRVRHVLGHLSGHLDARACLHALMHALCVIPAAQGNLWAIHSVLRAAADSSTPLPEALADWTATSAACDAIRDARGATAGRIVAQMACELARERGRMPSDAREAVMMFATRQAGVLRMQSLVGIAFAVSRWGAGRAGSARDSAFFAAMERELVMRAAGSNPNHVASVLVSLTRLGHRMSVGLAAQLCTRVHPCMHSLTPQNLISLIWALGRFNHTDAVLLAHLESSLQHYCQPSVLAKLSQPERRATMTLAMGTPWALATTQWPEGSLDGVLAVALKLLSGLTELASAPPPRLSSMLWGLGVLRVRGVPRGIIRKAFAGLAGGLGALSPRDLCDTLSAAARLKYLNHSMLLEVVRELTSDGDLEVARLSASSLTDLAFAIGRLQLADDVLLKAVAARLRAMLRSPECEAVNAQQLATWLSTYASVRYYDPDLLDACVEFYQCMPHVRFKSLAALSTTLGAFAMLDYHPAGVLDHCLASLPDIVPVGCVRRRVDVQIISYCIKGLWALAVLNEWQHALLSQLLLPLSSTSSSVATRLDVAALHQLAQFMFLAAASGYLHLAATVPDHLRQQAVAAWRSAVAAKCAAGRNGGASHSVFESTVSTTLRSLNVAFEFNVAAADGLLHFDFLLRSRLRPGVKGFKQVALDLWNPGHLAINCTHLSGRAKIRMRLAASRQVKLVPLSWQDWSNLRSADAREAYVMARLRNAGLDC